MQYRPRNNFYACAARIVAPLLLILVADAADSQQVAVESWLSTLDMKHTLEAQPALHFRDAHDAHRQKKGRMALFSGSDQRLEVLHLRRRREERPDQPAPLGEQRRFTETPGVVFQRLPAHLQHIALG